MPLEDHLAELRRRLIYVVVGAAVGMIAALLLTGTVIDVLRGPFERACADAGQDGSLIVTNVSGGFSLFLRVALWIGLILSMPWTFLQFWLFIAAGLYPHERRPVLLAVPVSVALFAAGAAFFFFIVAEPTLRFFVFFNQWMGAKPLITLQNHISFMSSLMLLFGLGFQTPLVLWVLGKVGLVSASSLGRYRRHVIVAILLLAAILTPPDVFSQIALALPIWGLYELGVLAVWLTGRRRRTRQEETR